MAKLALNKSSLSRQTKQLKSYREFLPSLDLKRRQLMAEQGKARKFLRETEEKLNALEPAIETELPMLSNMRVDLTDIVKIAGVELTEENVMGTRLPRLDKVNVQVKDYALLGKPHWVDRLTDYLVQALEIQVQIQIARRRLELIEKAVNIITQRVNLFDKVLIPRTQAHIKKIRIFLSDAERDGVVRAKLAKNKKRAAL